MPTPMITLTIRLTPELHAQIKAFADNHGSSFNGAVSMLLGSALEDNDMTTYHVHANNADFGLIDATTEQEARDKAAQMAGYKDEDDMVRQLEAPSELIATEQ